MLIIYSAVPRAIVCLARNLISDTSLCLVDCLGLQLCSAIADTDTDSTYHNAFLRQTDSNPKSETCVRTVAYVGWLDFTLRHSLCSWAYQRHRQVSWNLSRRKVAYDDVATGRWLWFQ